MCCWIRAENRSHGIDPSILIPVNVSPERLPSTNVGVALMSLILASERLALIVVVMDLFMPHLVVIALLMVASSPSWDGPLQLRHCC